MAEPTVESIFGTKAGIIWNALNDNGPGSIGNLAKTTSLSREEICGALGWLGRENKLIVEMQGRAMIFSLREAEGRWQAIKGLTLDESLPQEQTSMGITPEKGAKVLKVKSSSFNPDVIKRALAFILSEFEANREPTPTQVSNAVGMDSRQLGKVLSKLDIKSETINREGKNAKIYPLTLRAKVWELEALDAKGLQEMAEVRARAIEEDRGQNQ